MHLKYKCALVGICVCIEVYVSTLFFLLIANDSSIDSIFFVFLKRSFKRGKYAVIFISDSFYFLTHVHKYSEFVVVYIANWVENWSIGIDLSTFV